MEAQDYQATRVNMERRCPFEDLFHETAMTRMTMISSLRLSVCQPRHPISHNPPVSSPHASLAADQTALILLRSHNHIHMHAIHPSLRYHNHTFLHSSSFTSLSSFVPICHAPRSLFPFPEDMSAFADPNAFHLDEGTIITRHGTSGTRRDMRRDGRRQMSTQ